MAKKKEDQVDEVPEVDPAETDSAVEDDARAAEIEPARESVGDVKSEDIPNKLDSASNLPPEVRAELVEQHPVDPGAHPAPVTVKEQPMPVVTGTREGAEINDPPIVYFTSEAHPELVVWHPNGDRTVQFHNGRLGTANAEWQAVLRRTPEVSEAESVPQGGALVDSDGSVIAGAVTEPIRASDVVPA